MPNRLAAETSPYLRQHADNPVDWFPWGEEALTLARTGDRPILLSIGYSACHWCHVMAHESFEDEAVAAVMNRLFVNIKVDREERPDLDQIYQTAHQILQQRPGGWPLTMFLTPDGTPFFGGTYFPKSPRYGLPGFAGLCEQVAAAFRDRRRDVEEQNRSLRDALASLDAAGPQATELDARPLAAAREVLVRSFDGRWGGFGGAPKFPHPTDLALLWRRAVAEGDEPARGVVLTTLTRMAEGGIHDHLGGGFCRYSVDERWEIPHFEKMLYDNGPLLALYGEAAVATGDGFLRAAAEGIAAWTMREMQAPAGGYYSSLDADSEGEEGRYYVWDRDEVRRLLTDDQWAVARRAWGLDEAPNFEDRHWHLKLAAHPPEVEAGPLRAARATLFAAREERVRPGLDDKMLTSWNALMIAGMARAGRLLGRPDWVASAFRATDFLRAVHWRQGRLLATSKDGRAHLNGYLDDHAFLLAALLELLQCAYRPDDLAFARDLADGLLANFEDPGHGGFFFTRHDHEALIQRPRPGHDNATPSGNGVAATALQRLGHLLGEPRYLEASRRTLAAFQSAMRRGGGWSSLCEALEEALVPPTVVVLRGPADEVADWTARLAAMANPGRLVLPLPNGIGELPPGLAKPETDRVNAWVCRGVTCLAPAAGFEELERHLRTA